MKVRKFQIIFLVAATVLSGCSQSKLSENTQKAGQEVEKEGKKKQKEGQEEITKLMWYLGVPNASQKDMDMMEAEFNKITREKINSEVDFTFIDFGNYGQQMQIMMASGEKIDLMHTTNWTNNFYADVSKGAYQPIEYSLIEQLGSNIIEGVPRAAWDAARVKGELYAIPNTQVLARWPGVIIQEKYVQKYGLDVNDIKEMKDLTPFLEQVVKNEAGVFGVDINRNTNVLSLYISKMGLEYFAEGNPFGIRIDDKELNIINMYETEEMKDFLYLLREWYLKGIIRKDAATVTDSSGEKANGLMASMFAVNNPDTIVNQSRLMGLRPEDLVMIPLSEPYLATSSVVATMTAIGKDSKYQHKVIELYNLMYDKEDTTLINLLSFGVEGTHYNKVSEDTIELIPNSGYYIDCGWAYGNLFNCYKTSTTQPDWYPSGPDINDRAIVSNMMGFSLDPTLIKTELAQMSAVFDEFIPALMTGTVDVDEYLEKFLNKLKSAGSDKVKVEIQAQINEWKRIK